MITVEEACEIMLKEYKEKPYITKIKDVGQGYYMVALFHPGELTTGADSSLIHKDTGRKEYWFYPDHFEEIKTGIEIKVPEKYVYRKA